MSEHHPRYIEDTWWCSCGARLGGSLWRDAYFMHLEEDA